MDEQYKKERDTAAQEYLRIANAYLTDMEPWQIPLKDYYKTGYDAGYKSATDKAQGELTALKLKEHMQAVANTKDIYSGEFIVQENKKLTDALVSEKEMSRKLVEALTKLSGSGRGYIADEALAEYKKHKEG